MSDKPKCKARIGTSTEARWNWGCHYTASRDGFCGIHHPDAVAKRKRKRGTSKAERLDAVLTAAREVDKYLYEITNEFELNDAADKLCTALQAYDRGAK